MHYLLILAMSVSGSSVAVVQQPFDTKELCESVGNLWVITTSHDLGVPKYNVSYTCAAVL